MAMFGVQTEQPGSVDVPGTTRSGDVTIRHLRDTQEDSVYAATIMVDAFEGKMGYAVGKEKLPTLKRVMSSYFRSQPPQFYTRNLIAELNGRPVGFMGMKFKGDQLNEEVGDICDLGCWGACRLICFDCVLGSTVKDAKRCLVDVVGVDSFCRGRGVGKALLDRADEEARKEGCKVIYLMVITTNPAIRLYERQRYQIQSTHSNCCFRCVAGPPGSYHVMEKAL